jgi:Glycosyltransferase
MARGEKARLLLCATAPVIERDGKLLLDKKFVEGMRLHCQMWPGPVTCILRRGAEHIPFGGQYERRDLGFDITLLESEEPIGERALTGVDVVLCAGDAHDVLHLADLGRRLGIKVIYTIEYTLETRLRIAAMDKGRSLARRVYSMLWNIRHEYRRRRAFRLADGIQANGYPAMAAYGRLNRNSIMYLDNRLKQDMYATAQEMKQKAARLRTGGPLRIIHSGRLERMKGAHDLIPTATALRDRGVDFTLDIYGDGSLREEIAQGIRNNNLGQVRLHGPVDFETELVPINRTEADIFLSCHRQSDPSCTYIECLGCGLPVAGYDNAMWSALLAESGGGWAVPMGRAGALAEKIAQLATHRDEITRCAEAGLRFARQHDFVAEFARRMDHARSALEEPERWPAAATVPA